MADYTFASVIISADIQSPMQELVGTGYFNSPLSADGTPPATHYISSGPFDNDILNAICNSNLPYWISFGMDVDTNGLMPATETEE